MLDKLEIMTQIKNIKVRNKKIFLTERNIWRSNVLSHWGWLKGKPKRL